MLFFRGAAPHWQSLGAHRTKQFKAAALEVFGWAFHFSSPVLLGLPQGLGWPTSLDRGASTGACKTDPVMTQGLFSPEFTEPGQHKPCCSDLTHLSVLHAFTQNLAEKTQFFMRNAVIILLAAQGATVTCNVTSCPCQQGLAVTALRVEGAVGSRGRRLSVFSLTKGQLPLEVETCSFVLKLWLEESVTPMKSHCAQFLAVHSVYNISRYQYVRQEVRLTTNHKPLEDLHLCRLAVYGYTVTLNIKYFWLQPFKDSFLDLVLFHVCKQGLKIFVK